MNLAIIIADDSDYRKTFINILKLFFIDTKFILAESGKEGFQIIKKRIPDLVFVDISLPGENGLEVIKQIRKAYPELTLVCMANDDLSEYRKAAEECGANLFLSKSSSTASEIHELVESIIS